MLSIGLKLPAQSPVPAQALPLTLSLSADSCALLRCVQVLHPDDSLIRYGKVWLEPMKGNDVVTYVPWRNNPEMALVPVHLGANNAWIVDGLATADTYTDIFQVWPPPHEADMSAYGQAYRR